MFVDRPREKAARKMVAAMAGICIAGGVFILPLPVAAKAASCKSCHGSTRTTAKKDVRREECHQCHNTGEDIHPPAEVTAPPSAATVTTAPESTHTGDTSNPMILIPAGDFIMGSDNRLPDEGPQHKVRLGAYYIDKYEVTNAQYKYFIDTTPRRSPDHFRNRTYPEGKTDHPVVFVSWFDAQAYCEWAGKRLPTDQEWEKAARGTDGRMFPWGNEFDANKANTPQRWKHLGVEGDTMPVGSFEAGVSPYGLYDMSGNVWEWTASWYKAYPGNAHPSENYGEKYRTLKGGSWWDCSFYKCGISAPSFNRAFFLAGTKNKSFGFRCARDAESAHHKTEL